MTNKFLPQQWLFWVCHIGGWLCVSLPFVHLDVGQLDAVWNGTGAMEGTNYSWQTELLRFMLTLPVLLSYRYLFITHRWRQLDPVELISLTLGFNLVFAFTIAYLLPYRIPHTEWWFEWFQKETSGTTRAFDEKVVSFLYSYTAQVMWCLIYIIFRSLKMNRDLEQQEENMQGQLKSAQISSLSSQISPHFLFNAMNNICCLMDEDVSKAQTALRAFSDVLRFSLDDSVNQTISIKDEMNLVTNYIEVVSIQFEDKLQFETDIPEDVKHFSIPPMLIQLLVENAIKHGISQLKQGGFVKVSIVKEALVLRLFVENSGSLNQNKITGRKGVGLQNLRQRLQLVYGHHARFSIEQRESELDCSSKQSSVLAQVTLPKLHCR